MIYKGQAFTLFFGLICFSSSVFAHQQKAAITQILINERSGHLEIAHRFYTHDAEHAVKLISGNKLDIFKSPKASALFYTYVIDHFDLLIEGQTKKLEPIGFEIEGDFFWAYQEMTMNGSIPSSIEVRHSSLQEFWPDQINTVNFESASGQVKTALFEQGSEFIQLEFQSLQP